MPNFKSDGGINSFLEPSSIWTCVCAEGGPTATVFNKAHCVHLSEFDTCLSKLNCAASIFYCVSVYVYFSENGKFQTK